MCIGIYICFRYVACPECRNQCRVSQAVKNVALSRALENGNRPQRSQPAKLRSIRPQYPVATGRVITVLARLFVLSVCYACLTDQDAELDERSTIELVKRLGFPTGLARTVINQEKRTGMRIFILDNVLCERVDIHYKMEMHCVGLFAFNPPIVFTAFTRHCTVGIYIRSRWMCNGNGFDETS